MPFHKTDSHCLVVSYDRGLSSFGGRRIVTLPMRYSAAIPLLLGLVLAGLYTAPAWAGFEEGTAAYERGDYAATLSEWRPLAEQGDPTAQHHLGWLYIIGHGVPQDYEEAVRWFRKAAEQGDRDAQTNLGSLYLLGDRLPQDYSEALKWLRAAADQGHPLAQTKLGIMYEDGEGVRQDRVQAYMWFSLAAAQGSELESAFLTELTKEMSPTQIVEAQRLVREWNREERR